MFKTKMFGLLIGIILVLSLVGSALAAGTVTITKETIPILSTKDRVVLTLVWTADSSHVLSDATINATTYQILGYYLISSETLSGATAPTDASVIAIKTASGSTLFTMTLSNSTTVGVLTNYQYVNPINGNLTFSLSGNSVNSATGTCKLTFAAN